MDHTEPEYIHPSVLVHQFLTHLAYSNFTYTSRLLTHVCADYTRIKHLIKGVRRYYNERIHTAEDTIRVLYKNKRSLGSVLKHSLGIADHNVQLKMKQKIMILQDEDFQIKGLIDELDFRILFNSERLVRFERAATNAASMIENFERYLIVLMNSLMDMKCYNNNISM